MGWKDKIKEGISIAKEKTKESAMTLKKRGEDMVGVDSSAICEICNNHLSVLNRQLKSRFLENRVVCRKCFNGNQLMMECPKCQTSSVASWDTDIDELNPYCDNCYTDILSERLAEIRTIAENKGGKCLSDNYQDSSSALQFECEKGHQWHMNAEHLRLDKWCPICAGEMCEICNKKIGILKSKVEDAFLGDRTVCTDCLDDKQVMVHCPDCNTETCAGWNEDNQSLNPYCDDCFQARLNKQREEEFKQFVLNVVAEVKCETRKYSHKSIDIDYIVHELNDFFEGELGFGKLSGIVVADDITAYTSGACLIIFKGDPDDLLCKVYVHANLNNVQGPNKAGLVAKNLAKNLARNAFYGFKSGQYTVARSIEDGITDTSKEDAQYALLKEAKNLETRVMRFIENNLRSTQVAQMAQVTNQTKLIEEEDIPSKIKKLSVLKEEGILTEEEFQAKKKELLERFI